LARLAVIEVSAGLAIASPGRLFTQNKSNMKGLTDRAALLMVETRRRSARIDLLTDMIPARFYLGGESSALLKSASTLDPAMAKSTSKLVAEAAAAAGSSKKLASKKQALASASEASGSKKKKADGGASAGGGGQQPTPADARSRMELREKLEKRIVELREERRRTQSEKDKARRTPEEVAKAEEARAKAGKGPSDKQDRNKRPAATGTDGGNNQGPAKRAAVEQPGVAGKQVKPVGGGGGGDAVKPVGGGVKPVGGDADIETGKLVFETKSADLPWGAGIGRRGAKVSHLKKQLRDEEDNARKLRQAESEGRGDEVRTEQAMKKALARAKGEKVHDDVGRLRKQQKLMDRKKVKGRENWNYRIESETQRSKDKQSTRRENLTNKRLGKKSVKAKAALKETDAYKKTEKPAKDGGQGRAGFEGKHKGFVNSEK